GGGAGAFTSGLGCGGGIGGGVAAEGGSAAAGGSGLGSGFGAGAATAGSGLASGFGLNGLGWVARVSGAIVTRSTAIGISCGGGRNRLGNPSRISTNRPIWSPADAAMP